MYKIKYNDSGANDFFDTYKNNIIKTIKEQRVIPIIYSFGRDKKQKLILWEGTKSYVKDFLDKYSQENNLRKLITGKPNELLTIVSDVKSNIETYKKNNFTLPESDISDINNSLDKIAYIQQHDITYISDFKLILKYIFVDNFYEDETNKFDKARFVKEKDLKICPYCGRNYIFFVTRKNGTIVKPQIDHFLPKSKYPYLALSYYNLIPCCETCNMSSCKGQKDTLNDANNTYKITHPYEREEKDRFFELKLNNINVFSDFILANKQNIEIGYNRNIKIEQYEDFFAIQSLYKEHNDLAHELLIRKQFWTTETCKQYYENLLSKDDSLGNKMILSLLGYFINANDHGKRPFSKLLNDISDYYDELIKKGKT
jgi:hypothetical protein